MVIPLSWTQSIGCRQILFVATEQFSFRAKPSESGHPCIAQHWRLWADVVEKPDLRVVVVCGFIVASVGFTPSRRLRGLRGAVWRGFGLLLRGGIHLLHPLVHEGASGRAA